MQEDRIVYYACSICDYEDTKMGMHCLEPMGAVWLSELGDWDEMEVYGNQEERA